MPPACTKVIAHAPWGALRFRSAARMIVRVMRALILSLAAAGLVICSLPGYAGGERYPSYSRLEQVGRTVDDEPNLKPAGTSSRPARLADADAPLKSTGASSPGRAADQEAPLKTTGASSKPGRSADDDAPVKPTGASSKTGHAADDDQAPKSTGSSIKPERKVEEIAPVRATGGVNKPARIEDDSNRK